MKIMRKVSTLVICLLPASMIKNFLLSILGHEIRRSAHFGPNLVIGDCILSIGSESRVRPFNIFRNVQFSIGNQSIFGSWNWVSAAPALRDFPNFQGLLKIEDGCGINSRNYFDCSGGIFFESFADLAGVRSTFITHFIDTSNNKQTCKPIRIGESTMLSSNLSVAPGASVGSKSVVAMGTVLINEKYPSDSLIAGVPGKVKAERQGEWFDRKIGPSNGF